MIPSSVRLMSVILKQNVLVVRHQPSKMTLNGKKNKTVKVPTYSFITVKLTLRLSLFSTNNNSKERKNC